LFEEIRIENGQCSATVIPQRGGLISELEIGARPLLYLDRSTVEDRSKSVRGGIPVLFPFAGKLDDDRLALTDTVIPQHGFARNKPWSIIEQSASAVKIALEGDEDAQRQYPFDFVVEQTVTAEPDGLRVELQVVNRDSRPMPISPGWHPYFLCPASGKSTVETDLQARPEDRFSNDREFDFGIPAPANGLVNLEIPGSGLITLGFSPEMRHLQFWSQPGKNFICVEPFWGPANSINTEQRGSVQSQTDGDRLVWMNLRVGSG